MEEKNVLEDRIGKRMGWDRRQDEIGWEGCPAFGCSWPSLP